MKQDRKKGGKVPNLRFPEFEGEWEVKKINTFTTIKAGATPSTLKPEYWNGSIRWMSSGELNNKKIYEVNGRISELGLQKTSTSLIPVGCVLIGLAGQGKTRGTAAVNYVELCTNQSIASILPSAEVDTEFLYQNIESRYQELRDISSGDGGRGGLNLKIIGNFSIPVCSLREQQKIAKFLILLDERISTQNKIIEKLESLIRGIYFAAKRDNWEMQFLKDILEERDEQNSCNCPVYSVAVREGVINQIEHLGRSFAAKDTRNYNVVHYGDIVYTKSPTGSFPYGIVKQSFVNHPVAVSPLYGVYKPKNPHIANILHYYFLSPINANNYLHSLIQKGAKNTINITSQRFLDKTILLPTNEMEIKNISLLLGIISKKNQIEKDVQKKLYTQKAFLLQQMFI